MKKIIVLFVSTLFVGASLVSCSSDDDKPSNSAKIVGKWHLTKITETAGDEVWEEDYEHDCPTKKDYFEFKGDGTYDEVYYDEDCLIDWEETNNWSITNGTILNLIYSENDSESFEIQTLNNSVMIITQTEEYEGEVYTLKAEFKRH